MPASFLKMIRLAFGFRWNIPLKTYSAMETKMTIYFYFWFLACQVVDEQRGYFKLLIILRNPFSNLHNIPQVINRQTVARFSPQLQPTEGHACGFRCLRLTYRFDQVYLCMFITVSYIIHSSQHFSKRMLHRICSLEHKNKNF